jgi:phosphatidylglycerophosphatase C
MTLVFFDFDGTLTTRDTIFPFGFFLARSQRSKTILKTAQLVWWMTLLKSGVISNHEFKQQFCRSFLKGESERAIEDLSKAFIAEYVTGILNGAVVDALHRHQQTGDQVYLVSSNFAFLLRPLQQMWNSNGVIATNPEVKLGRFTGRLSGPTCDGPEKLSRVLDLFGWERVKAATAYGDSRGDVPLLSFVKKAVWV